MVWEKVSGGKFEADFGDTGHDLSEGGRRNALLVTAASAPDSTEPTLTLFSRAGVSQWSWYPGAAQIGEYFLVPFDDLVPVLGTGVDIASVQRIEYAGSETVLGSGPDISIKSTATLTTSMTDTLLIPDGVYATGDIVQFQLVLSNVGVTDITDVVFTDSPSGGYSLVPGSVTTTKGTVALGNGGSDTSINVNVGFVGAPPCSSSTVTITFQLQIDMNDALLQVCNFGTVTATGINTVTDDSSTPSVNDPNCSPPIDDTVPPVISIVGNNPEFVECTGIYVDAGATAFDGRDGDLTGAIMTSGSVDTSTPGDYFIMYEVEDSNANSAAEIRTVTVQDTTPPLAECRDITIQLNAGGTATIVASDLDNGSGDTCGSVSLLVSQDTFTCADIGANFVALTVTDDAGNSTNCNAIVMVEDPLGVCPQSLCDSPNAAIPDSPNPALQTSMALSEAGVITDLNVFLLGTHSYVGDLVFTLTHVDTGTFVVLINRPANGVGTCSGNNFNLILDDEGVSGAANSICTIPTWITTGLSYTPANPLSLFDGESLQGTWTLSVQDFAGADTGVLDSWCLIATVDAPPVPLCKDISISLDEFGAATINAVDVDAGSTDAVGIQDMSVSPDTFDCTNLGNNTVTLEVMDTAGQISTCNATVTVNDVTAPVITLNGNASETVDCGDVYADAGATAADACDSTLSISTVNPVDANQPGIYVITYDVTDDSGNAAVQVSRTVTVSDNCVSDSIHSADVDGDSVINLVELLRLIQFFNLGRFHCDPLGVDGYNGGPGDESCTPHDSDYNTQNWVISLLELLRLIQFFNLGGYHYCPAQIPPTEDGFCPGP